MEGAYPMETDKIFYDLFNKTCNAVPENIKVQVNELLSLLKDNDSIINWNHVFREIGNISPGKIVINMVFFRRNNSIRSFKISYPLCFNEKQVKIFLRYLYVSIYNRMVSEGAEKIVVFCSYTDIQSDIPGISRDELTGFEELIVGFLKKELAKNCIHLKKYCNFDDDFHIMAGSHFETTLERKVKPGLSIKSEFSANIAGIDVGGTNIKTVVYHKDDMDNDGKYKVFEYPEVTSPKESAAVLKNTIINILESIKAKFGDLRAVGISLPSPMDEDEDSGDARILRLTNFESGWRDNGLDIGEQYKELNRMKEEITERFMGLTVAILNDANAFGYNELARMKTAGEPDDKKKRKRIIVVLPVGTGPGYVKIINSRIEHIPQQGGHMIIHPGMLDDKLDLSLDKVLIDNGCKVAGCFGGYVPGIALQQVADLKRIRFDNDRHILDVIKDSLTLLDDMSKDIVNLICELYFIFNENADTRYEVEFKLAGGVFVGERGKYLLKTIGNYKDNIESINLADRKNILISCYDEKDIKIAGAKGAAIYANSIFQKNAAIENKEKYNLPKIFLGKGIIAKHIEPLKNSNAKIILIAKKEVYNVIESNQLMYFDEKILIDEYKDNYEKFKEDIGDSISENNVYMAVGAGKVIDWSKYAVLGSNGHLVIVPSVLSTNSMFTEKSIFYCNLTGENFRKSETVGTAGKVIIDLDFMSTFLRKFSADGNTRIAGDASRSGLGEILCIKIAQLDWQLDHNVNNMQIEEYIYEKAEEIYDRLIGFQNDLAGISDLSNIIQAELLAEASLINMEHGSSRPKDGSEHLLAFEFENILLKNRRSQLHGSMVAFASVIMSFLYNEGFQDFKALVKKLGLPVPMDNCGLSRDDILKALVSTKPRKGKYTFFDLHRINELEAQGIYKLLFEESDDEKDMAETNHYNSVKSTMEYIIDYIEKNLLPIIDNDKAANIKTETMDLLLCLVNTRHNNGRVIINAAGRIGEIAEFLGNQLYALGFNVVRYVEGTPEFTITQKDLVLTLSGSGNTMSVRNNLNTAIRNTKQACYFAITANPASSTWKDVIGEGACLNIIHIHGITKDGQDGNTSNLPYTSSFEYSVMFYLEGIIEVLINSQADINIVWSDNHMEPFKRNNLIIKILEDNYKFMKETIKQIEINTWAKAMRQLKVTEAGINTFINWLLDLKKDLRIPVPSIYFYGLGRNNSIIRLFARRLQNIGYNVYVPGPSDIISAPNKTDLSVFLSSTGNREIILGKAKYLYEQQIKSRDPNHFRIVTMTSNQNAELHKYANLPITLFNENTDSSSVELYKNPMATKNNRDIKRSFEAIAMFIFEGISVVIMNQLKIGNNDLMHVPSELE
jgi:glycerol dehydrogenase-like iron-containing ADH family enzyme/D-arabinose 5-phosphate isomerase GutQ/predicted NBD/HSP70 family sugar kinase